MASQRQLAADAKRLATFLIDHKLNIVFAESCTGGLVSAMMTQIPGISAHNCGSAVVYQLETKTAWLGISPATLKKPGPVSRVVATEMAVNVLTRTPHADASAAITGHLGPDAPKNQDGLVYVAVAARSEKKSQPHHVWARKHWLKANDDTTKHDNTKRPAGGKKKMKAEKVRIARQREAAHLALLAAYDVLNERLNGDV